MLFSKIMSTEESNRLRMQQPDPGRIGLDRPRAKGGVVVPRPTTLASPPVSENVSMCSGHELFYLHFEEMKMCKRNCLKGSLRDP